MQVGATVVAGGPIYLARHGGRAFLGCRVYNSPPDVLVVGQERDILNDLLGAPVLRGFPGGYGPDVLVRVFR